MATAGIHLSLLELTQRKANLEDEIAHLQSQRSLALYAQKDKNQLQYHEKADARRFYKEILENDLDLQEEYVSYEDMPEYRKMIDMISAKYQDELAEITAWDAAIENQITTASAELEEIKAWEQYHKQNLTTNISDDFGFGLDS